MATCASCGDHAESNFCPECGHPLASSPVERQHTAAVNAEGVPEPGAPAASSDVVSVCELHGEPSRSQGRRLALLSVAVILAVAGAGTAWGLAHSGHAAHVPVKHRIAGGILVDSYDCDNGNDAMSAFNQTLKLMKGKTFPCPEGPGGGYSDISAGAQVTVRNQAGKLLAVDELSGGQMSMKGISFEFILKNVPDAPFYTFQIGNRSPITYSAADMNRKKWLVLLSLG